MENEQFNDDEILDIIQDQETGMNVAEISQLHGIPEDTLFTWMAKFSRSKLSEARRLRTLEQENHRLRSLVAEQALSIQALQRALAEPRPRSEPQFGPTANAQGETGK
jgi:putative transposase